MLTLQKIQQQISLFVFSKKGKLLIKFTAALVFIVSAPFIIKNTFLTNSSEQDRQERSNYTALSSNENRLPGQDENKASTKKTREPHALAQLFNEQSLNNSLIPKTGQDAKSSQMKSLESAFLKNDLQTFGFTADEQTIDPMEKLSDLIQEIYSTETPLLNIAQEINASIFRTFEYMSIQTGDLIFSESAVRISKQGDPYPFIILELSKAKSHLPYFQSQKEREQFITVLLDNLANRNLPRTLATKNQKTHKLDTKVRLVDEEHFIYITFNNIISHVIRFEPRKERIASFSPLKKNNSFYFTLIIDDVGENMTIARKLMELPFPVILSIWPQSTHGTSIATLAYEKGVPVFLHQPMEPLSAGNYTPNMGKGGLKVGMSQREITHILQKNILSVPHLRGINNHMGSKFTTDSESVDAFLFALKDIMPQVLIIDSITHNKSLLYSNAKQHGFLTGQRNYFIDNEDSNTSKMLNGAYAFAKRNGHAYVIGHARRETLSVLLAWDKYKDKNIIFALPSY